MIEDALRAAKWSSVKVIVSSLTGVIPKSSGSSTASLFPPTSWVISGGRQTDKMLSSIDRSFQKWRFRGWDRGSLQQHAWIRSMDTPSAGPQLHDETRDLVCQGKLSHDNPSIALMVDALWSGAEGGPTRCSIV